MTALLYEPERNSDCFFVRRSGSAMAGDRIESKRYCERRGLTLSPWQSPECRPQSDRAGAPARILTAPTTAGRLPVGAKVMRRSRRLRVCCKMATITARSRMGGTQRSALTRRMSAEDEIGGGRQHREAESAQPWVSRSRLRSRAPGSPETSFVSHARRWRGLRPAGQADMS